MKHKNSHLLVGYWNRIRGGHEAPDQTDIDPRAIKRLLAYTFILDCRNPARPLYRLAGTGLCERFGFELRGTSFLALWETQSSFGVSSLLRQSLKLAQPVCLSSVAATADNAIVELETILAPVTFNGDTRNRFFGMVQILSDPAVLLGHDIIFQRLVGSHFIEEDGSAPHLEHDRSLPPPSRALASKKPHLRLVVSRGGPQMAPCDRTSWAETLK